MRYSMIAAAAAVLVLPTATSAQSTVQQDFEAATQLNQAQRWSEAVGRWSALEARVSDRPRSLALVRLRKATALLGLDRRDEAATAAQAGLAAIPSEDATLRPDRYEAHMLLARIASSSLDYATASEQFTAARALATTPADTLASWWGQVDTGTFVDPQATLAIDGEYDTIAQGLTISEDLRGQILATRARLYLNAGDVKRARSASRQAVERMGGMTSKTDLNDVSARSMAALAAFQDGAREEARRYLALTGAGRSGERSLDPARYMEPPACGGDAGLKPDDMAIIEFSVGEDGSVVNASPVWSNRQGDAALAFARAARSWSWAPGQLDGLAPFYRYGVRVEMRCSTAFERPSLIGYASDAFDEWVESKGATPIAVDGSASRQLLPLRQQLAQLESAGKGDTVEAAPVLYAIARSRIAGRQQSADAAARLHRIAASNDAPPLAMLAVEQVEWATAASDGTGSSSYQQKLDTALVAPAYASDPAARAMIALLRADLEPDADSRAARAFVQRAANEAGLPDNHPLKVGALIRLASLDYREGRV